MVKVDSSSNDDAIGNDNRRPSAVSFKIAPLPPIADSTALSRTDTTITTTTTSTTSTSLDYEHTIALSEETTRKSITGSKDSLLYGSTNSLSSSPATRSRGGAPGALFGRDLADLMGPDLVVPIVVTEWIDFVYKHGMNVEGKTW